jgi:hypothetical protein
MSDKSWMVGPEWRKVEEQILGDMGYLLRWTVSKTWADVVAYRIAGLTEDGIRLYGHDLRETPNDDDTDVDGYIKWDGCAELDQGCPHWCGPRYFKMHIALLTYLYQRAQQLMGSDFDRWDDTDVPLMGLPAETVTD